MVVQLTGSNRSSGARGTGGEVVVGVKYDFLVFRSLHDKKYKITLTHITHAYGLSRWADPDLETGHTACPKGQSVLRIITPTIYICVKLNHHLIVIETQIVQL